MDAADPACSTVSPAGSETSTSPGVAAYGRSQLSFVLFADASDTLLNAVADGLDTPSIREFMIGDDPHPMIFVRRDHDLERRSVHAVVLCDGQPVGWVGWFRFELDPSCVETSTFLMEHVQRTGLNRQLKHLQYQAVLAADRTLVFSVNENNVRSVESLRKQWPVRQEERCWEKGVSWWSTVIRPFGPPVGFVPWDAKTVGLFAELIADLDEPTPLTPTDAH